jgi:DNA-binding response OmpR family regulator
MRVSTQLLVDLGLAADDVHGASVAQVVGLLKAHEAKVAAELARQHGHPAVVLSASTLDLSALGALSKEEQQRLKLLPLALTEAELSAAVPSVEGFVEADDLSYRTGRRLKLFIAPEPLLVDAIEQAHAMATTGATVWVGSSSEAQAPYLAVERATADDAEAGVAALLAGLSSQLAQLRASAEAKPSAPADPAPITAPVSKETDARAEQLPAHRTVVPAALPEDHSGATPFAAGAAAGEQLKPLPLTPPSTPAPTADAPLDAASSSLYDLLFPEDETDDAPAPGTTAVGAPDVVVGKEAAPEPDQPPRVIVIEDEDAIRTMMVKLLEKDGYNVVACSTGQAGVEALRSGGRPDLVVTDAMLPGVHGFEICSRIKHSDWSDVPVILVSAVYKGVDHAREIQEKHGADAFLEKPFPVRLLRDMVASHLGRSLDRAEIGAGARARLDENRAELKAATQRGDVVAMKQLLLERVRLDPFDARARAELGGCHEQMGELDHALYAYESAFVYDEQAFDIATRLAALYGRLGFLQRARQTWGRAHLLAPDDTARRQVEKVMTQLEAQGG